MFTIKIQLKERNRFPFPK